jgi:hypothetical protein
MAQQGGGTRLERLLRLLEGAYGRPPRALRRSREAAARLAERGGGMAVAQRARRRPRGRWPRSRSASSRQPIEHSYLASFVGYVRCN